MKLTLAGTLMVIVSAVFLTSSAMNSVPAKPDEAVFKSAKAGKFTLSYKIQGENLVAKVSYPGSCWISVGFNPKNVMQNANIIMGTVVEGKSDVSDQFGDGMFSHKPDTVIGGKNNIIDGVCAQADGITTLSFTIPLNSLDPKDGVLAVGVKVKVIFAAGATGDTKKKHKEDAKTIITL